MITGSSETLAYPSARAMTRREGGGASSRLNNMRLENHLVAAKNH